MVHYFWDPLGGVSRAAVKDKESIRTSLLSRYVSWKRGGGMEMTPTQVIVKRVWKTRVVEHEDEGVFD